MRWALCLLAIAPHHLFACGCLVKFSLCQEVAASSQVFIGKVESVYPFYLDSANRRKAVEFQDEVSRLHSDPAPAAVDQLKAVYSNMLGGPRVIPRQTWKRPRRLRNWMLFSTRFWRKAGRCG